jgi:tRNA(Ile)-lysidine synthase
MIAKRDYTGILICIENNENNTRFDEIIISDEDKNKLENGKKVNITLKNRGFLTLEIKYNYEKKLNLENIPQKKYTKWFDYDKIKRSIVIRTRNTGDYLTVNSLNQKKNLKSYFTDEKIPQSERDSMLLIAEGSHVIWLIGARISNYYKLTKDTQRVLCVTYTFDDKGEV